MGLDPVTLLEDSESLPDSSMEVDRHGKLLSKDHDSGPTLHQRLILQIKKNLENLWMVARIGDTIAFNREKMSPRMENREILSFELGMSDLRVKIREILRFLLVVSFIYQYLMGYVERGQWNTYSNGAWEFRATYVCIELRLGSYPFQKFRETQRKYSGVTERKNRKTGIIDRYEPWVRFRKPKFYFEGQTTAEKAARIRDVAKFWLKIKERQGYNPYNFGEEDYNYLNFVQEFHPQQSDDEVKRLVLEHAQRFLKEVQQPQVPIVHQPCVEPASGEDWITQDLSHFMELEEIQPDDINEQTADMIEEPQSVTPNLNIAGPTIEENVGEGQGVLALTVDPSLSQPRCTSKMTLMAPCNCIADISDVEVFQREKWQVAAFKFAASNMSRRCELEGCSEGMHDHICLQKSGNVQELFCSDDMWAVYNDLKKHGWEKVPF